VFSHIHQHKLAGSAGASPHICLCSCQLVSQNQIKSEEQFQAKKSELRAAALERLETTFDKKGKVRVMGQQQLVALTLLCKHSAAVTSMLWYHGEFTGMCSPRDSSWRHVQATLTTCSDTSLLHATCLTAFVPAAPDHRL
jgi:hypothetical protein